MKGICWAFTRTLAGAGRQIHVFADVLHRIAQHARVRQVLLDRDSAMPGAHREQQLPDQPPPAPSDEIGLLRIERHGNADAHVSTMLLHQICA